jgi:hypothetical protein
LDAVRVASELFLPYLTDKPKQVLKALGFTGKSFDLKELGLLYARLDLDSELKEFSK